jgi:DNA invertase Pin-like site-specific DNA recombinase
LTKVGYVVAINRKTTRSRHRHFAYLRTNPTVHVGADRQRTRQRAALGAFARSAGYEFVGEYYDADVSGRVAISKPRLRSVVK